MYIVINSLEPPLKQKDARVPQRAVVISTVYMKTFWSIINHT